MRLGGPLEILQLWVNLPAKLKMTAPRYMGLQKEDIPSFVRSGATVHLIAGEWDGNQAPIQSLTGLTLMTVELKAGARLTLPAPRHRRLFLYIVRGEVRVSGTAASSFQLVDLNHDGDSVEIEGSSDALIIFAHADPLGEPIAAQGPFVMNTREEIVQTIRDYQSGAFGVRCPVPPTDGGRVMQR